MVRKKTVAPEPFLEHSSDSHQVQQFHPCGRLSSPPVNTVDGGGRGGGEHGADAVPTLPAARETWYAAALALERAFAAGPRWRRRRRWRQLLAPEWPGAEVEEGEEDQAVGRTR